MFHGISLMDKVHLPWLNPTRSGLQLLHPGEGLPCFHSNSLINYCLVEVVSAKWCRTSYNTSDMLQLAQKCATVSKHVCYSYLGQIFPSSTAGAHGAEHSSISWERRHGDSTLHTAHLGCNPCWEAYKCYFWLFVYAWKIKNGTVDDFRAHVVAAFLKSGDSWLFQEAAG